MADNYLENKFDAYLERKAAAEKAKKAAWRKRMDAYRKKLAEQQAGSDEMKIIHDIEGSRFQTEILGFTAYVSYVKDSEMLDIKHTIVPKEIGGKGIAAALVKAAYDYALSEGLKPEATCSYAAIWLERHPEYKKNG